jgi:hypothetical protein
LCSPRIREQARSNLDENETRIFQLMKIFTWTMTDLEFTNSVVKKNLTGYFILDFGGITENTFQLEMCT